MNIKPTLIDKNYLDYQLKNITYFNNTNKLSIFLCLIFIFLLGIIIFFSRNYSKKINKEKTLNKLFYIRTKSNKYIDQFTK